MVKENERIHNFLMSCKEFGESDKSPYEYRKDGIYASFGPYDNRNLTKDYSESPDGVIEYLERIMVHERTSYKLYYITDEVIKDLKNNY